jgi:hypothetical protein
MKKTKKQVVNKVAAAPKKKLAPSYPPRLIAAGILAMIVLLITLAIVSLSQHRQLKRWQREFGSLSPLKETGEITEIDDANATGAALVVRLTRKVGRLMRLPQEAAFLITVQNSDQLQNHAFLQGVQDGDQVLIFPQARKVVIYREEENLIINAGPIEVAEATGIATDSGQMVE